MKVLIACECSGTVRDAFISRGHSAISCDTQPSDNDGPHYQGDVFDIINFGFDLMIAHPPCTFLTVTGNKWFYHPDDKGVPVEQRRPHPRFPNRRQDREAALEFFIKLATVSIPLICVENPVGVVSTRWRKPDQIIQPFEYGHPEPKKTCLWLKGLPKLQPTKHVEPEYHITKSGKRMPRWYAYADKSKGQAHRAKIRSKTFQGIADAMAAQWSMNA